MQVHAGFYHGKPIRLTYLAQAFQIALRRPFVADPVPHSHYRRLSDAFNSEY